LGGLNGLQSMVKQLQGASSGGWEEVMVQGERITIKNIMRHHPDHSEVGTVIALGYKLS